MSSDTNLMLAAADALREAAGARAKFPGNRLNHMATIEEVGEHAQALLEHSRGKTTAAEVYAEAIQCAAMYLRLAVEGTAEVPYEFSPAYSRDFVATTPKPRPTPATPAPVPPIDLSRIVVGSPARPPAFGGLNPGDPDIIPYHGMTPPPGAPGGRPLYTATDVTPAPNNIVLGGGCQVVEGVGGRGGPSVAVNVLGDDPCAPNVILDDLPFVELPDNTYRYAGGEMPKVG